MLMDQSIYVIVTVIFCNMAALGVLALGAYCAIASLIRGY